MARDNLDIEQEYDSNYQEGLSCWNTAYQEMEQDYKLYLGDQFTAEEKSYLAEEGRSAYVYNYTMRNVNLVTGHQRKNRLGYGVDPTQNEDMQKADTLGDMLIWQANRSNFYNTFSDGFEEAAITGASMLSFAINYENDPINGDIINMVEPFQSYILILI